jgi:PilZ domain
VRGLFAKAEPDERMRVGSTLTCKIVLPSETKPVCLTGKISRLIKTEVKYGIGVTFKKINAEYLNQINKYLFKRPQELILQKRFRVVSDID